MAVMSGHRWNLLVFLVPENTHAAEREAGFVDAQRNRAAEDC